jgi:hypothetical protein
MPALSRTMRIGIQAGVAPSQFLQTTLFLLRRLALQALRQVFLLLQESVSIFR